MMPERFAFDLARRAALRRARALRFELRRGLSGLATIAATAAFWGFALTCWNVANMFKGISGPPSFPAHLFQGMSDALLPTLISLPLGVAATVGHRWIGAEANRLAEEADLAARHFPKGLE